jgi:hypothetical protein
VGKRIRRRMGTSAPVGEAAAYIYISTACNFWLTLTASVWVAIIPSLESEQVLLFTLAGSLLIDILSLAYFHGTTRRLYTAIGLSQPSSLWRKPNRLFPIIFWPQLWVSLGLFFGIVLFDWFLSKLLLSSQV